MITNKKIVLTGANSGIGWEVLKLLARGEGNVIFAVDKNVDRISAYSSKNVIPFQMDVSTKENVDVIFDEALAQMGDIDIFYANAGYPYYEEFNYVDWDRVKTMFDTNVFSPIYSYQKYVRYLNGRPGVYAITVSAIGKMAMPGFAVYTSSKFAMEGFQQAIRLEKPDNVQLTCLYPVATDKGFFKAANEIEFKKPFPVQKPIVVAKKMVKGIEKGKKTVSPCALWGIGRVLMTVFPFVKTVYWNLELKKFKAFKEEVARRNAENK